MAEELLDIDGAVEDRKQYIVVKIGDEEYGLDIFIVDNIVRMLKITRVPQSPDHYMGVINLRGEVVPVMSVRRKMGLADDEVDDKTRIIVLRLPEQGLVGLLVDEVKEVITLAENEIERNVRNSKRADAVFINGIGKNGDDLVSLFDLSMVVEEMPVA